MISGYSNSSVLSKKFKVQKSFTDLLAVLDEFFEKMLDYEQFVFSQ